MSRFRNIYIEITNRCNLFCSFCPSTSRPHQDMSAVQFLKIFEKVAGFSEYFYLHVMGEPLLNAEVGDILSICDRFDAKIKLTTNGTLLPEHTDELIKHPSLKTVNISLSCLKDFSDANSCQDAKSYLKGVFCAAKRLVDGGKTTVLRAWTDIKYFDQINQMLYSDFGVGLPDFGVGLSDVSMGLSGKRGAQRLADRLIFDLSTEFEWPVSTKNGQKSHKKCLGLVKQLAILVDGTVVPCCLDSEGEIDLGNINTQSLAEILASDRAKSITQGFRQGKANENFCQTCTFGQKFAK